MPQPFVHLMVSITMGYLVGFSGERNPIRKFGVISALAVAQGLIDLDHFLLDYLDVSKVFHAFLFVYLPLYVIIVLNFLVPSVGSKVTQRLCLLLFVMMLGHILTDLMFGSELPLQYPTSTTVFTSNPDLSVSITSMYFDLGYSEMILFVMGLNVIGAHVLEKIAFRSELRLRQMRSSELLRDELFLEDLAWEEANAEPTRLSSLIDVILRVDNRGATY